MMKGLCLKDEKIVGLIEIDCWGANYMIAIGEAESRVMVVFHVR